MAQFDKPARFNRPAPRPRGSRTAALHAPHFQSTGAAIRDRFLERAGLSGDLFRRLTRNPHLAEQVVTIALRGTSAAGKFLLSLYLITYLGLADLGVYGLLVAAATAVPAILGFGLSDWTTRQCVGLPTEEAVALAGTRLGFTVFAHAVVQPVFWLGNAYLGGPIPAHFALPVALILLFEHLGADANGPLIARQHAIMSSVILFIRAGAWPLAIIAIGFVYPPARSMEWILGAWLTGLGVMMAVIFVLALYKGRWRMLRIRIDWLRATLRRSWPFYLSDIGAVSSLYADRFIISFFAGLAATGIYVFFWSAANVVHSVTLYGTFHPRVPMLVTAAKSGDAATLRKRLFQFQGMTFAWALLLFACLWVLVREFLHMGMHPQLNGHLTAFALIIVAALLRILADSYHFLLYALARDRIIAAVNLSLAGGSALLNAVLVSTAGLTGAVTASVLTAGVLLAVRRTLSRF